MDKLKPCPFCGGEAKIRRCKSDYGFRSDGDEDGVKTLTDSWTVECENQCCRLPIEKSKIYQDCNGDVVIERNGAKIVVDIWNRRAADEPAQT